MANFDRDFGYLMPFLDKIEAAAASASPDARAELTSLVRGEKERWRRIQALLSGAPPAAAARPTAAGPDTPTRPAPASALTVGSLRRG